MIQIQDTWYIVSIQCEYVWFDDDVTIQYTVSIQYTGIRYTVYMIDDTWYIRSRFTCSVICVSSSSYDSDREKSWCDSLIVSDWEIWRKTGNHRIIDHGSSIQDPSLSLDPGILSVHIAGPGWQNLHTQTSSSPNPCSTGDPRANRLDYQLSVISDYLSDHQWSSTPA